MSKKNKRWYEVRVRECVSIGRSINGTWVDGKYVKKSKFYEARDSADAGRKYKGKGQVMSVEKASKEKLLGIGAFFSLGDSLLKEFRNAKPTIVEASDDIRESNVKKNFNRKTRKSLVRTQ